MKLTIGFRVTDNGEWRAGVFHSDVVGRGATKQEAVNDAVKKITERLEERYPEGVLEVDIANNATL